MAISIDTFWGGGFATNTTTVATPAHSTGASCTLIVVGVRATSAAQPVTGVTDNNGTTYTQVGPSYGQGGGTLIYLFAAVPPHSTSLTITAHNTGNTGSTAICAATFNGIATTSAFDKTAGNFSSSAGTTLDSGATAAVTFPNGVAIGFGQQNGGASNAWTAGGSYTKTGSETTATSDACLEYLIFAGGGAQDATLTSSVSASWTMGVWTFADTPVPGPTVDAGATWIGKSGPSLMAPFNVNQFAPFGFSTSVGFPLPPQGGGSGKYRRRFHRYT